MPYSAVLTAIMARQSCATYYHSGRRMCAAALQQLEANPVPAQYADLLSSYAANDGAALGSYTETPMAARDDDADFGDFDGFVSGEPAAPDSSAGGLAPGAPPAAQTSSSSDPADQTEAVLSSLPDLSFMLDRGRSWPARHTPVATHS